MPPRYDGQRTAYVQVYRALPFCRRRPEQVGGQAVDARTGKRRLIEYDLVRAQAYALLTLPLSGRLPVSSMGVPVCLGSSLPSAPNT